MFVCMLLNTRLEDDVDGDASNDGDSINNNGIGKMLVTSLFWCY